MKNTQRPTPKIPDGMVELLKNLAKSVLKEQPENIYVFAAEYFENLVRQRDGGLDKGYSTFRKYDDEFSKQHTFVCPRCNYVLHPDRREVDSANGDDEGVSPKNDDSNTLDMSVNGVAIKAVPRDGKVPKGPKNRQRLETIRSVSMDSAIEDDGKSQSTSPKSNENASVKSVDRHLSVPNINAMKPINVNGVGIPAKIPEEVKSEMETTTKSSAHDVPAESTNPTTKAEDDIDSSTNETSTSDVNTDRTVIEMAPLNTEMKMETEITTVITEPTDEQTVTVEQNDQIKNVNNLHLDQVKQIDQRLRTPESDSGLSEKSFNLNIQENEDAVTAERNQIKNGNVVDASQTDQTHKPDQTDQTDQRNPSDSSHQDHPSGKDFDTESKDDSGIVEFEESPNENEPQEVTNDNENHENDESEKKTTDNTDNSATLQSPSETNEQKSDISQNANEDRKTDQSNDKEDDSLEEKPENTQPERPNAIALHTNLKPHELVEQYHKSPEMTSKTFEDHVLNHMKATSPMASDETAPTFENGTQNNEIKRTDGDEKDMTSTDDKIALDDKSEPQVTPPKITEQVEIESTTNKLDNQSTKDPQIDDEAKFPEKSVDENQFPVETRDLTQQKSSEEKPNDETKLESETNNSSETNDVKSPNESLTREKRDILTGSSSPIENVTEKPNNDETDKSLEQKTDNNVNSTKAVVLDENKESEMKENVQSDIMNESNVAESPSVEKTDVAKDENNSKIDIESDSEQVKSNVVESNVNTEQTIDESQDGKDEIKAVESSESEKPIVDQTKMEMDAIATPENPSESGSNGKLTDSVEQSEVNQTKDELDNLIEGQKSPSIEKAIDDEELANETKDAETISNEKVNDEKSVENTKLEKSAIETVQNDLNVRNSNDVKTDEKSDKMSTEQSKPGTSPLSDELSAEKVTENDNKGTEVNSSKQSSNEASEMQLDLKEPDEISDDVYTTPPETSNDHTSAEKTKSTGELSPESNADVITNEIEVTSKVDLPANENDNELNTSKPNDIENGNLNSVKPENGHLVDEVKESQSAAEYDESDSRGVNESSREKSAMPAEGDDMAENKTNENQGTSNNNNENIHNNDDDNKSNNGVDLTNDENGNLGENVERKKSIEQEQSNENENENDDAGSELSASAKDDYEKAETEIVGDESVKDLDLSSTNDLDANLANESAESEQQITALDIAAQNDNDSIDSSPKQNQMQPDSLDILADSNIDSLDVSLEPSVEADSLNIDSIDEKTKSAKSTGTKDSTDSNQQIDRYDEKDATNGKLKHDNHGNDNDHDNNDNKSPAQSTTDQAIKNDSNKLSNMQTAKVMGDIVDSQQKTNTMHDQMRNELEVLRLAEKSASAVMLGIDAVNLPKSLQSKTVEIEVESNVEPIKPEDNTASDEKPKSVEIKEEMETVQVMDKPDEQATEIGKDLKDASEITSNPEIDRTVEIVIENQIPEPLTEDVKAIDEAAKFGQTVEVVIENQSTIDTKNGTEQVVSDNSIIEEANNSNTEDNLNTQPIANSQSVATEITHSVATANVDSTDGENNAQKSEPQVESLNNELKIVEQKTIEKTEEVKEVQKSEKLEQNSAEDKLMEVSNKQGSEETKIEEENVDKEPSEQSKSEVTRDFNADLSIETEKEADIGHEQSNDQVIQETIHRIRIEENGSAEESSMDEEMNIVDMSIVTEITIEQNETDETIEMTETSMIVMEAPETERSEEAADTEPLTCVEYLKPISNDTPSSDLSDTETTDKAEKTESGVDETSRDERDEVSEIENFDLSSCGEDSLEAMYYMIRKNEIIMDRHKQTTIQICEEEKMVFPDKATDDLEHAVREVSGKKMKLCSIGSMNNSSTDDVVLKKLSSDSDEIQVHVIPNSEIDSSSSELKSCPLKEEEQCTANESTDDEYMNPILDSMRKNDDNLNEMQAKALSVQPNRSDSQSDDQQQTETDTFNEHLMDDMMRGNIERKILASSVSEADSDYFEMPPTTSRLTKDDFNVSTAFEHMIRTESTTEDSDSTIESAATKIQATARGFITRRRLQKSSAGTSASVEKRSSIGNAAIDKSLDNLIEQQEMLEENAYSEESFEESSVQSHEMLNDPTIDSIDSDNVLGITEINVKQRKDDKNETGNDDVNNDENIDHANADVPGINIQGVSEESATAQRRLMLQRGDAMQRNDTPESSEQQSQQQQQQPEQTNDKENANNGEMLASNEHNINNTDQNEQIKTPPKTTSKPISKALRTFGPRQRSMPVQIDTQLMRVLPKHSKKRVQSANSASSKPNVKRPQLF